jgi:proteasome lid subunit RPN8/RPN11
MIAPIPKPAPAQNGSAQGVAIGTIYQDAFPVFVHEPLLEEILDYSEHDPNRELGGFLVGGLHVDNREYIEIRHFLPAVDARSRAASLTFTHETWSRLNREVDRQFSDEVVLGWHHTHPNFGIFLSGYDLFIHRHFFSEPWQVAMVVDPQRQEFGFFQWRQGEVVDCGFVCVANE